MSKTSKVVEIDQFKAKLIALVNAAIDVRTGQDLAERITDHLIANGVSLEEKQATSDESKQDVTDTNVGKWISVSERLPNKGREYLCFCNIDGNIDYPFYMILRYYIVDEKPHFQHECEHGLRVTHWMPLPEPPKGE